MEIDYLKLKDNEVQAPLHGQIPKELEEVGCRGDFEMEFVSVPIQEDFWVTIRAKLGFLFECRTCGSPRRGKVRVETKVMLKKGSEKGLLWSEDEGGSFDEYWVEIGPDIEKIPILSLIREQVLLNCNSAKPEEGIEVSPCEVCKNEPFEKKAQENKETTDPRWEKLKGLLKKEDN